MNDSLLILLVIGIFVVGIFSRTGRRQHRRSNYQTRRFRYPEKREKYELNDFPYELQNHFLTPAELNFFQTLRSVVGSRAIICPKARLGDLFLVKQEDNSKFVAYSNKINRKHVDFLLCDPATMKPLVSIELDDKSHQREDRQERDAFVNQVFAAAKLPLLHVATKRAYVVEELSAQLAPYLVAAPVQARSAALPAPTRNAPITSIPAPSPAPSNAAPHCPTCGSKMILRKTKSGANAGRKFWGCSNYPSCRGMVAYTE